MKKVLMIAFHYPPLRGSSGIQRTLKFSRYLPTYGWQPIVLTAQPQAYSQTGNDQMGEIPPSVIVERAWALDTMRHLSIGGMYWKAMASPDRWVSWWLGAMPAALRLVREHRPQVLWSTYPIATAHLIALTVHRLTGIPWVADFRDPMTEPGYPPGRMLWRLCRGLERAAVQRCVRAVFTTPGALRTYKTRYPTVPDTRWSLIENGYDEENFLDAEHSPPKQAPPGGRIVLVHSGLLYTSERDPRAFFAAVAQLRRTQHITPENLQIILRASGAEETYSQYLRTHGIEDIVRLAAHIPYREALTEMLQADGLLLFQSANSNDQIPAKTYEYLRARRPIFAMTDAQGDTAHLLRTSGVTSIVPLHDQEQIAQGLLTFLQQIRTCHSVIPPLAVVQRHSRLARTQELAALLDTL